MRKAPRSQGGQPQRLQAASTSVVIGASKVEQIEENVRALDNLAFTHEELHTIDALTLHTQRA